MNSLHQFKKSDLYYNPEFFDEKTLEGFLQEDLRGVTGVPPSPLNDAAITATANAAMNFDLTSPSDFDPAFAQAWEWMNKDPEIRQGLAKSGLSEGELSEHIRHNFEQTVDQQSHAEFIEFFNANRMQVTESNGTTTYKLGGVPVLEGGDTLYKAASGAQWFSLIFDVVGLCFALAACRVQYKIGKPAHLTGAVRRNAVNSFAEAAKYADKIDKHYKDLKVISAICTSLSKGCNVLSGTLRKSIAEALDSLSWKDWALAIGGILTSLAAIVVSGGAAIAVKWVQVSFATVPVLKDIKAICNA
jgi:hypothetical protein